MVRVESSVLHAASSRVDNDHEHRTGDRAASAPRAGFHYAAADEIKRNHCLTNLLQATRGCSRQRRTLNEYDRKRQCGSRADAKSIDALQKRSLSCSGWRHVFGGNRMNEQPQVLARLEHVQRPFTTSICSEPDSGGWITVVNLGEGATLSRWFEDQDQAERYGDELEAWLSRRE